MTLGINNPEIHTPNLDRLASEGTYFSRAYTVNPTCTPTRATLITGKYPSQHGAWTLGTKLPESEHTVGEDFQQGGYRTALVGKAHFQPLAGTEKYPSLEAYPILQDLEFWKNFKEKFYGFETVKLARNHTNEAHVGQHYAIWLEEKGCRNWREYFLAPTGHMDPTKKRIWDIPEEYHYDVWIAEQTNALLEQYKANGENAFRMFTDLIGENALYLLDEPENSLSPARQQELCAFISDSARFFGCQFVIATHSPFLLSMRGAKIYDLDSDPVDVRRWTQLEHVRLYYEFFREHAREFERDANE